MQPRAKFAPTTLFFDPRGPERRRSATETTLQHVRVGPLSTREIEALCGQFRDQGTAGSRAGWLGTAVGVISWISNPYRLRIAVERGHLRDPVDISQLVGVYVRVVREAGWLEEADDDFLRDAAAPYFIGDAHTPPHAILRTQVRPHQDGAARLAAAIYTSFDAGVASDQHAFRRLCDLGILRIDGEPNEERVGFGAEFFCAYYCSKHLGLCATRPGVDPAQYVASLVDATVGLAGLRETLVVLLTEMERGAPGFLINRFRASNVSDSARLTRRRLLVRALMIARPGQGYQSNGRSGWQSGSSQGCRGSGSLGTTRIAG